MKNKFTLLLFIYFGAASFLLAQNSSFSHLDVQRVYKSKHYPSSYTKADFFDNLPKSIRNNDVTFNVKSESNGGNTNHSKLQQYYKNTEIIGAIYVLHSTNGYLDYSNGLMYPEIKIENQIGQSKDDIEAKIIKNPYYYFPLHDKEKELEIEIEKPADLVLIDRSFPSYSGRLVYAYKYKIHSNTSLLHSTIYVNAETSKLVFDDTHVCTHSVQGSGQSYYYGEVDFECDQISTNEFLLHDPTRGNDGINIVNGRTGDNITSTTSTFNLSKENYDNTAIDALYCTSKFYDLMFTEFSWNGLDNLGRSMNCVINTRSTSEYINAYWNGSSTYYGNGSCSTGPLTTLSIIGHEFMHGITDYTSDLIYFDESGALNESLSDIFGKYLESIEDSANFSWELDSKIQLNSDGITFRSMSDPNLYSDPDTYGGEFWGTKGSRFDDNSYVHSNSGVLNYWYYLLSEGGSGINDHGTEYNVPAIGMESAIQILWRCQKDYLTSTSSYNDLALSSVEVAGNVFGENSLQYEAILEAWKAVGVDVVTDNMIQDLTIDILNSFEYCITDSLMAFDIELTNVGNVVWEAGANVLLQATSFFQSDEEINYTLTEDLLPGESVIDVVVLAEKFSSNFLTSLFIELLIIDEKDENHSNNSDLLSAIQYSNSRPILTVRRLLVSPICHTDKFMLEYQISNTSCQSVDEPTSVTLEIYNGLPSSGDLVFSKEIVFEQGVNSKADLYFEEEFDESFDESDLLFAIVTGEYTSDDSPITFISHDLINPVSQDGVSYEYENLAEAGKWGGFGKLTVESEPNNNVLAHTSFSFTDRDISCKTSELIFHQENSFFSNTSRWIGCVDFSNIEFPEISFDTKFFRNDDGDENSAMIRVYYQGETGSDDIIIKGLNEDEWYEMQYDLPSYFVGEVIIELFAHLESFTYIPTPENDAIFIDNLFLGDKGVVSTAEILTEELTVYPNPVRDILNINDETEFDTYEIYSSHGLLVNQGIGNESINVEALAEGLYFIRLLRDGLPIGVGKFVR